VAELAAGQLEEEPLAEEIKAVQLAAAPEVDQGAAADQAAILEVAPEVDQGAAADQAAILEVAVAAEILAVIHPLQ